MFAGRENNVHIFNDTKAMIEDSTKLQDAVLYSITNQKIYPNKDEVKIGRETGSDTESGEVAGTCKTVVSTKRSFEAAEPYAKAGKKVCVLNFASATNPGGGVTSGASAQEECLCRCSTLYFCLDTDELWDKFYYPHREAHNPLYNDDCIYSPNVQVIKSDISYPERLNEADWYEVDVLTCAAPNLRAVQDNLMNIVYGKDDINPEDISEDGLLKLYNSRIEKIFRVAAANGAEVLILGAFGCGAFRNKPELVSRAFESVQRRYGKYFDTIEYAVFCGGHETDNYKAFREVFGGVKTYNLTRFVEAHNDSYKMALSELRNGRKETHWMWYIFPQVAGLGRSRTAELYSIADIDEAKAYLADELLGSHMIELCKSLLRIESDDALTVMGYPDNLKLKSSMTLFEQADPNQQLFGQVLDKFFSGKRDVQTLKILGVM